MRHRIEPQLAQWCRTYNRRRLAEALLMSAGVFITLSALLVIGQRATSSSLPLIWIAGLTGGACLVMAAVRYERSRVNPLQMALAVDLAFGLRDLMSTAYAVDTGMVRADPAMGESVLTSACHRAPGISLKDIGPFRWPRRAMTAGFMSLGILVCTVLLTGPQDSRWPPPAVASVAQADGSRETGQSAQAEQVSLSEQSLRALRQDLERLSRMRERIAADRRARDTVDQIRDQIGAVTEQPGSIADRIGALSLAERHLHQLARDGQDGALLDEDALAQASPEELVEALREAISQGDAQTAAELVGELARRTATADGSQLEELGQTVLGSQADESDPGGQQEGSLSAEERETANQHLSDAGRHMSASRRQAAVGELAQLMDELMQHAAENESPSLQTIQQALADVRATRQEQLAALHGSRGNQAAGGDRQDRQGSGSDPTGRLARLVGAGQRQGERHQESGSCQGGTQGGPSCSGGQQEGQGPPNPQGGQGNQGFSIQLTSIPGPWGSGGTNRGPGQGPTPTPWMGPLPPFEMPPSQWIESQWENGREGLIEMIAGASHGERSVLAYQEVLFNYASLAEAVSQREDIPLTRRYYIQRYFEAIRP